MPNPLSTWWSIWPMRTRNEIFRRRRRQRPVKLQTWSTWTSNGCNSLLNNHHSNKHPPTTMKKVRWRQRRTSKARRIRRAIEREDTRKTRRDAVIGNAVDHRRNHRAILCHNITENLAQWEASAGSRINGTSNQQTVRIAKNLAAMAFPTRLQKVYRMQNTTKTRSGRVGEQNGSVKRSASPTRSMTTAIIDGVRTWTTTIASKDGQW